MTKERGDRGETSRFHVLRGYSFLMRLVGWVLVGAAALVLLASTSGGKLPILIALPSAIAAALLGLGYAVFGELLSCFLAIEENTRQTRAAVDRLGARLQAQR